MRESNPPFQRERLVSWPIDERAASSTEWEARESNPPPTTPHFDGNGFTGRRGEHLPMKQTRDRADIHGTGGSRTRRHHPGLSRAALPVCVPCRPTTNERDYGDSNPDLRADNAACSPCTIAPSEEPTDPGAGIEPARSWSRARRRLPTSATPEGMRMDHSGRGTRTPTAGFKGREPTGLADPRASAGPSPASSALRGN